MIKLFFSYSHQDEILRDELAKHLRILEYQGVISSWHDRKILPGEEWVNQVSSYLNSADIILLLISADFIASNYCWDVEVRIAMERHEAGEAKVIPVLLRKVDWYGAPFGRLKFLPENAVPITSWSDRDAAFENVTKGIRAVANEVIRLQQQKQESVSKEVEFDVTLEVGLTSNELCNGGWTQISFEDELINVAIPAGILPGKRLRLRGKGKVNYQTQKRGDLYLKIFEILEPKSNLEDSLEGLISERNIDYRRLRKLLSEKRWREADQETRNLILKATNREGKSWFIRSEKEIFKTIPCADLNTMDNLWVKYSNGNFGFSVQKQIYDSLGQDLEMWSEQIGWRKKKIGWYTPHTKIGRLFTWIAYDELTFNLQAPKGHLPALGEHGYGGDGTVWLFPCIVSRLLTCNIS